MDDIRQIALSFTTGKSNDIVDIITFCEADWGLKIRLYPTQKCILKMYYGLPLDDTTPTVPVPDIVGERILATLTEKAFLQWLYKEKRCNTDITEGVKFRELVMVIGRRGTKTTIAAIISAYELYKLIKRGNPAEYYNLLGAGDISVVNVATTDEQAERFVFTNIKNFTTGSPYLKDRVVSNKIESFKLATDADIQKDPKMKTGSLSAICGGSSSKSVRGSNAIVVIMDEFAYFIENGGIYSSDAIYTALTPSVAGFRRDGKIIMLSSPYAKYGKFYDKYLQSFEEKDSILMVKMYSALCNLNIDSEFLKTERRVNKNSFMSEYGGEFTTSVSAWIDNPEEFKLCVKNRPMEEFGKKATDYYMGIDVGLKIDGTAIALAHKEDNKIIVDLAKVWFGAASDVWDNPNSIYRYCNKYASREVLNMDNDIVGEIVEICRNFRVRKGAFDQNQGYGLDEMLRKRNLIQFRVDNITENLNHRMYDLFKTLYLEQLIELPNDPVIINEMLCLESQLKNAGKMEVKAPSRNGFHDDVADAIVRAVWECYNDHKDTIHGAPSGLTVNGGVNVGNIRVGSYAGYQVLKERSHGKHPRFGDMIKRKRL